MVEQKGRSFRDRPVLPQQEVCQFRPTPSRTLDTLLLTERIEAIAATAISERIMVNSTTVAPRWSLITRRKNVSIPKSPKPCTLLQTVLKEARAVNAI